MSYDPPLIAPLPDYVHVPAYPHDAERTAAFATLLESLRTNNSDEFAKYDLPYPKHEFLRFAAEHGGTVVTFEQVPHSYVLGSGPADEPTTETQKHDSGGKGAER